MRAKNRPSGLAASSALHMLVLGCAVWLWHAGPADHLLQHSISVELVSLPVPVTAAPSRVVAPVAKPEIPVATPQPAPAVQAPKAPQMIHATKMLASAAFADPKNAGARKMLGQLSDDTRREQLCGIEAVEQIHAHRPDWEPAGVVAYAFSDPIVHGGEMIADGAAVQIGTDWRTLKFDCTLAPDLMAVTGFDYLVGDSVPKEEWDAHGLPDGTSDDDDDDGSEEETGHTAKK